ncbi:MAG TPA: ABC transporter substrate-binding protein [Dehalococcoidia bacterium]|nr:ABC transporter substrate-binding protein [Dehalococcoidia bacterium]
MFKKFIWLTISCLLVAALALSSCGPAAVEEKGEGTTVVGEVVEKEGPAVEEEAVVEEEPEEEGPEMVVDAFGKLVEKPLYGGIITYPLEKAAILTDKDPARAGYAFEMTDQVYESPIIVDWAKGPQGTGETDFQSPYFLPDYYTGGLAESWEIIDFQTIVFQVRRGVHFQDKPPVNGREMTADDIIASFNRYLESPAWANWLRPEGTPPEEWYRMEKTGSWEITYTSTNPNPEILKDLASVPVTPIEMIQTYETLNEVELSIGTGPFILEDVVVSSSVTFMRNPNYWQMDYRHPDNRLPYADGIKGVVIEDISTRIAALRTHKVDYYLYVAPRDAKSLIKTNPELNYNAIIPASVAGAYMRTDLEDAPWSDIRVRQAMQMAVDYQEMAETIYEGTPYTLLWPIAPGMPGYTPFEELPDNLKELWTYNPDKAKQLLTEAGYPNGIKGIFNISLYWEDMATALQMYWADIGIDLEFRVVDDAAFFATITGDYEDLMTWFSGLGSLDGVLSFVHGGKPSWTNVSKVIDPLAVEFAEKFDSTLDSAERTELLRAENLRQMEKCWEIPVPALVNYRLWTPWFKGYQGENLSRPDRYAWIDQDLKYEITGQR